MAKKKVKKPENQTSGDADVEQLAEALGRVRNPAVRYFTALPPLETSCQRTFSGGKPSGNSRLQQQTVEMHSTISRIRVRPLERQHGWIRRIDGVPIEEIRGTLDDIIPATARDLKTEESVRKRRTRNRWRRNAVNRDRKTARCRQTRRGVVLRLDGNHIRRIRIRHARLPRKQSGHRINARCRRGIH